mmetsp:Transcript_30335/g.45251  ORF Transcript_30335/g.45251 Transcript_30335/m.45251 type:complete len:595 (+) Transcript_30335:75-1859(+)
MLLSRRCITRYRSSRLKISCIGHVQHILQDRNSSRSDSDSSPPLSITSSTHVNSDNNSYRSYCTVNSVGNLSVNCIQSTRFRTHHINEHISCNSQKIKSTSLFHTTTHALNDANNTTPTTIDTITNHLPESITSLSSSITIWGATAFLLTNFHTHLHLPYWACISLTNVCIRTGMLPIAVRGAKTSVKFGNIAPEVQYLITSFTRDFQKLKASSPEGGGGLVRTGDGKVGFVDTTKEQLRLVKTTVSTLQGVMRLAKVNLFDVFKSPMLQIPFFWYFALDLRKVINGVDPELAQHLVESSFLWITDLTEPDPWYGLPILTGALLYLNVEVAVGKRALSGETSSRSNLQQMMKDAFQSLAIFMPCFMVQQPSGVQIYLATSMVFTMAQSMAFRSNACRAAIGLPPLGAKPTGEHLKEFTELAEQRMKAKEETGFYLGEGILLLDRGFAKLGEKRESSIDIISQGSTSGTEESMPQTQNLGVIELPQYTIDSMLVYPEKLQEWSSQRSSTSTRLTPLLPPVDMSQSAMMQGAMPMNEMQQQELMDAANRGEKPKQIEMAPKEVLQKMEDQKKTTSSIDVKKFGLKSRKRGRKKPRK